MSIFLFFIFQSPSVIMSHYCGASWAIKPAWLELLGFKGAKLVSPELTHIQTCLYIQVLVILVMAKTECINSMLAHWINKALSYKLANLHEMLRFKHMLLLPGWKLHTTYLKNLFKHIWSYMQFINPFKKSLWE